MSNLTLQQIAVGVAAVLLLCLIVYLIRRRHLAVRFGIAWTLAPIGTLALLPLLSLVPGLADKIGFTPTGLLLVIAAVILTFVCLQLSMALSRAHDDIRALAEAIAITEPRLRELEHDVALLRADGGAPAEGRPTGLGVEARS